DDNLTYSATGLPGGLSIDQSGLISGEINYLASNGLPYSVKVTVVDDGIPAESDFVDFTWTVTNKNGPPIISPVSDQEDWEGTTINPPLVVNALDPDGDGFQFQAANLPPGLQIDADSGEISGTIAYHAVTSGSSKDYLVEIEASDDQDPANSSSELFVWRVNNVSGPPVVINPGDQRNRIGDDVSLQIQASDPDGDDISFSAENLPPNLVIHPATGLITGEIAEYAILNNPFSVTVTVKDDFELPHGIIHFDWMISRGEIYFPLVIH
ncbi:MAG: putative Ig domain-containing protein, partial [Anaerolineales bacterium]